ncbi:hypothetical protein PFMC_02845 [Plasmodium falciparum CAMP/Malaysia]|uniref:Phosphomannomutase n=2 Tax=Plasmodium falciparum TaxID=5833 RepID=A0A024X8M3_PLAFC|nr:hypothetical protein PFMC_02845 [Plasmodium falciparum CAMP/Malaysia]
MQKILIRLYKIYLILLSLKFYRFLFYRKYSIWKNENIFKKALLKKKENIYKYSIVNFLGEDRLKKLINYSLKYIANLDIPKKRGTFIELRNGIINISPIGRNCSQEERDEFFRYNLKNNTIEKFRDNLSKEFEDFDLNFSMGGQISIDCFPKGWDKTFCLKHLENKFDEIYFFGDRTDKGGNDYELFCDKRVKGYKVKNPNDTVKILRENFL